MKPGTRIPEQMRHEVSATLLQELRAAGLDEQRRAVVAYKMHRHFPNVFSSIDCTPDSSWSADR